MMVLHAPGRHAWKGKMGSHVLRENDRFDRWSRLEQSLVSGEPGRGFEIVRSSASMPSMTVWDVLHSNLE